MSVQEQAQDEQKLLFKRNYKACLNCRTRKVKCDLGSVDSPQPPCARCRRERRECVFAESKRGGSLPGVRKKKRKLDNDTSDQGTQPASTIATPNLTEPDLLFRASGPNILNTSNSQNGLTLDYNSVPIPVGVPAVSTSPNQHTLQKTLSSNYPVQPSQRQQIIQPQPATHHPIPLVSSHSTKEARANSGTVGTSSEDSFPVPPPVPKSSEFATMQGALVFLARAAGTIAKADDRDNINAREIHEQLESHESESSSNLNSPHLPGPKATTTRQNSSTDYDLPLIRPQGRQPISLPPVENAASVHPNPSKTLTDIPYIGPDRMLTEPEAIHLIELFFLTMHPFFPHIPEQLHSPQVLAGYPILLCAILTIASRYHPFESDKSTAINKNSRNIQLHERLWIYCQRLISQTVWAEASTRSIGTALAFLLFTEWNPRAIHWRWSDYANNPEFRDDMGPAGPGPEETEDGEGLAGLSAMRRSDRMAWMLVGTSVRLSQDMGFITGVPEIFVATHIAETNTAMSLGQRSMLSQSLGEVDLDREDDDGQVTDRSKFQHDEFILSLDEETMRRRLMQKKSLKFTISQKAKLELLKIMSLAYETIYCGTYHQLDQLNGQNLTILSVLSPLIENWYKTYKKLLKPSNPKNFNHHCNLKNASNPKHVNEITKQIDKESLISDYYYCQLYIYSLALSMENPLNSNVTDARKPLNNIRLDEISKAAKFVELAYNAAKEILNAAIRVHKLKMLKYMPVRWVTRVVRSVAFIVKCFLTLTNANKHTSSGSQSTANPHTSTVLTLSIIPTDDILSTIQKAAIVLREASPDELHLCTRYSTILMYLCSEMKYRSKLSANPPKPTKLDVSDDDEDEDPQESAGFQGVSADQQNSVQQDQYQQAFEQQQGLNQNFESYNLPNMASSEFSNFGYQQMGGRSNNNNGIQPLPDSIIDWFLKNDEAIGLDFVEPWTEMLEQHLDKKKNTE